MCAISLSCFFRSAHISQSFAEARTPRLLCPAVMLSPVLTNWIKWCPSGSCLTFLWPIPHHPPTETGSYHNATGISHLPNLTGMRGHVQGWLAFHIMCSWVSPSPKYGGSMYHAAPILWVSFVQAHLVKQPSPSLPWATVPIIYIIYKV